MVPVRRVTISDATLSRCQPSISEAVTCADGAGYGRSTSYIFLSSISNSILETSENAFASSTFESVVGGGVGSGAGVESGAGVRAGAAPNPPGVVGRYREEEDMDAIDVFCRYYYTLL